MGRPRNLDVVIRGGLLHLRLGAVLCSKRRPGEPRNVAPSKAKRAARCSRRRRTSAPELQSRPGAVALMRCNIPVQTACSGVEIRGAQSHEKGGTTISVALNIDLPVEDLIAALTIFQQSNERPSPEDLPSVFEAHKAQVGYTGPMKAGH
eukprot:s1891_g21.t1